jgi:hypothetical protein
MVVGMRGMVREPRGGVFTRIYTQIQATARKLGPPTGDKITGVARVSSPAPVPSLVARRS